MRSERLSLRKFLTLSLILAFFCGLSFKSVAQDTVNANDTVRNEVSHVEGHEKEAAGVHGHENSDKPFDPVSTIMEHISDAHDFHLWGEGHNAVSIPLPVILKTDAGLVTFSSKEFHHDNHGTHVVEKDGQRFVRYENKIYVASAAANEHGQFLEMKEGHPVNAMPLDFSITKNVCGMFVAAGLMLLIFFGVASAYKSREGKAPKGIQSLIEPIIVFVRDDIARPNIGHKYYKYMPFLLTVFFFIWINNLLGLIPIFPGSANVTGNISITLVLAVITLLVVNFSGNKYYWGHIFLPPVPKWLYPIMIPVELIGVISKPFSLMVRLFANITAGHIIVLSLISLVFIFKTIAIAPVSIAFVLFMDLLELLVAFLQAFIFTMLTALFIGMAVEEHHHDIDHAHGNH